MSYRKKCISCSKEFYTVNATDMPLCEVCGKTKDVENTLVITKQVADIFDKLEFDYIDGMFLNSDLEDLTRNEIKILVKRFGGNVEDFHDYYTEKFLQYFLIYDAGKQLGIPTIEVINE